MNDKTDFRIHIAAGFQQLGQSQNVVRSRTREDVVRHEQTDPLTVSPERGAARPPVNILRPSSVPRLARVVHMKFPLPIRQVLLRDRDRYGDTIDRRDAQYFSIRVTVR